VLGRSFGRLPWPRGLRARLLTACVVIAVVSVASTAWLTTRSTSEHLKDSVQRTLETDSEIYNDLLIYSMNHPDWGKVDDAVAKLARKTGRRIVLTDEHQNVIVDSARLQGRRGGPLPDRPAAVLDPFNPLGLAFDQFTNDDEELVTSVSDAAPPALSKPTPAEKRERRKLADQAMACLEKKGYTGVESTSEPGAKPYIYVEEESEAAFEAQTTCGNDDALQAPWASEIAWYRRIADATVACMGQLGVTGKVVMDPDIGYPLAEPPEDDAGSAVWEKCGRTAERAAWDPFVTDPARLYLGERNQQGLSFREAGSGRTLAAAGLVAAFAVVLTLLAARRILRPVEALTVAAQRMEAGDLSQRVADDGRDELGRLAHAFNSMADALAANEEQRRRLATDVAHELRTPLANIRGYVEAAQDGVTPTDPALLASLHEEAVLLQRLVDDLQTLSLAEAGRLPLHPDTVDVADLAAQVVAAFRVTADAGSVALAAKVEALDGSLEVRADPLRLRQVVGNLVANALRYTPAGGTVTVRAARDSREGDVVLAVEDTGSGIAADHLPHVFDRFWRADESRTRGTGGSGLGLAICHQLVEAQGGTITVASTLGEGSTFTIRLPAHSAQMAQTRPSPGRTRPDS